MAQSVLSPYRQAIVRLTIINLELGLRRLLRRLKEPNLSHRKLVEFSRRRERVEQDLKRAKAKLSAVEGEVSS